MFQRILASGSLAAEARAGRPPPQPPKDPTCSCGVPQLVKIGLIPGTPQARAGLPQWLVASRVEGRKAKS